MQKKGGLIALNDLYLYFNKTRVTCMIAPEELLKACQRFNQMNVPL